MPGKRHKWVKLREHTYICTVCGCGRVNKLASGGWETTFHLPDGTSRVLRKRPECEVGPKTEQYLGRYAEAIDLLTAHQEKVAAAISEDAPDPDAMPTMQCPSCGDEQPDFDGFGFLSCKACGHCTHPSVSDGVCGLCERNIENAPVDDDDPGD